MLDLVGRIDALTRLRAEFDDKVFRWGRCDCAMLGLFHLTGVGHAVTMPAPYRSEKAARAVMNDIDGGMAGILDAALSRIAPAQMFPADIMLVPGENDMPGLLIKLDEQWFYGFTQGHSSPIVFAWDGPIIAAWRV
jgi:hypothetical protein